MHIFHLASILFAGQPIGSILAALFTDEIGRKYALLIVCIPFIAGWIVLAFANSFAVMLLGFALIGLADGLMESPLKSLYSEIW